MAVTIELEDGRQAVVSGGAWHSASASLAHTLTLTLGGPEPLDSLAQRHYGTDRDWHRAGRAVDLLGGRIVSGHDVSPTPAGAVE